MSAISIQLTDFIKSMRSLFQTKHVHFRELVQNSLEAIHQSEQQFQNTAGQIELNSDPEGQWFSVTDNGIGMTGEEIEPDLTMIFHSTWERKGSKTLGIGQFGFGFCSVFLVADQVSVISHARKQPGQIHELKFDVKQDSVSSSHWEDNTYPLGTTVKLWLREDEKYSLDTDYILGNLQKVYLYAPYKILVNGKPLPIPTREQWIAHTQQPAKAAWVYEWFKQRYNWKSQPLHVAPLKFGNGGWLAIIHNKWEFLLSSVPPLEVYRKGIRISEEEMIPKPLNNFICGIIDVDEVNLKPDRETIFRDHYFQKLEEQIKQATFEVFPELAVHSPGVLHSIFEEFHPVMRDAMIKYDALRQGIGLFYPLHPLQSFANNSKETERATISQLTLETGVKNLYWASHPNAEQLFIERCLYFGKMPVLLDERMEQHLVKMICDEQGITFIHVAKVYFDEIKPRIISSPQVHELFTATVEENIEVLCCRDIDTRFPVVLLNLSMGEKNVGGLRQLRKALDGKDSEEGSEGKERMEGLLGGLLDFLEHIHHDRNPDASRVLVVNCANPIIHVLEEQMAKANQRTPQHEKLARVLVFLTKTMSDRRMDAQEFAVFMQETLTLLEGNFSSQIPS